MTLDELEQVASTMVKHGLTRVLIDGVTIERPRPLQQVAAAKEAPPLEDDFETLRKMSPDKQDAALMLRNLGRP